MNTLRTLTAGVIAGSILLGGTSALSAAQAEGSRFIPDRPTTRAVARALPPCVYEDSTNCTWRAGVRGNREGRSFVNLHGRRYFFGKYHNEINAR